ncbi:hypothetical protein EJ04DRAFT_542525 [Polyplosphaeria fusca]|uniref:Clr5 domain-containing protein n=1 Tax=Polyplosphaeria fusca TaxID=682080 RepID=A0A9P4V4Q7_9PLEO|nr:hypothetical protein EJ04DRAFT_542525 [Polyplosphaeria fusca]
MAQPRNQQIDGRSQYGHTQSWETARPTLERLYMIERKSLKEVERVMRENHQFDAVEHQYKYQFKKWGWKRNLSSKKKAAITDALSSRASAGKMSSQIMYKGNRVEAEKIRRYLKDSVRKGKKPANIEGIGAGVVNSNGRRQSTLSFNGLIFTQWNTPHGGAHLLQSQPVNYPSPFNVLAGSPGSDVAVVTPSGSAGSPCDAPSPTNALIHKKKTVDRAQIFFQGRQEELLRSLSGEEKMTMSRWFYEYWFFAFKSAKAWGRGPRTWTAETLGFKRMLSKMPSSLPSSPREPARGLISEIDSIRRPSDLCRWHIHLPYEAEVDYEDLTEEYVEQDPTNQNPEDESTWVSWPSHWETPPLQEKLRDALEHNDFSTAHVEQLPRSPDEMLKEAFAFAIMSRNVEVVGRIQEELIKKDIDVQDMHPLHLATSYLDGHKACCEVFKLLDGGRIVKGRYELYSARNEMGHTVLDNLMIAIHKSHTSLSPSQVDIRFRKQSRFAGQEVDICGRWDADSDCFRHLLNTHDPTVPFTWKHRFCHTSIQTICHHIAIMYNINSNRLSHASGLFLRRCFGCGLSLSMQPLHALVMTGFHLASYGCEDEDLFGILACALYLVSCLVDATGKASISIQALFEFRDLTEEDMCDHQEYTPFEFAQELRNRPQDTPWTPKVRVGWNLFEILLSRCESAQADVDEDMDDEFLNAVPFLGAEKPDEDLIAIHDDHNYRPFGVNMGLASLFAAVQAEIVTYRRLTNDCGWLSQYFNMEQLLNSLKQGSHPSLGYLNEGLLKAHCICGKYGPCYSFGPTLKNVCTRYIANLDVWDRAHYSIVEE